MATELNEEMLPYTDFVTNLKESLQLEDEDKRALAIAEAYVKFTKAIEEQIPGDSPKVDYAKEDVRSAETLRDYLHNPRNIGELENGDLTAVSNALTNISAFISDRAGGRMPDNLSELNRRVNGKILQRQNTGHWYDD